MSLLEELQYFCNKPGFVPHEVEEYVDNVTLVADSLEDVLRWSVLHTTVFVRKTVITPAPNPEFSTEYVAVDWEEPVGDADWDGMDEPTIYPVEEYEETVTLFRKV